MHALQPEQDRVWRAVLELHATLGRPPSIPEISTREALPEGSVGKALRALDGRDVLKLGGDGSILYAYPFTQYSTDHTVSLGDLSLNSLCAIDALGTGAMFGTDITINSTCRLCGETIRIATADRGATLAQNAPGATVVWYEHAYGESAAASCCQTIAFFCGDEHLQTWLGLAPGQNGIRLSISEALEVGRAIFGPVLQSGR